MSYCNTFQVQPHCQAHSIGIIKPEVSTLLQLLISAFCEISSPEWPQDYGEKYIQKGTAETFDFIVVGAGTAGSVVAGRLAENPNFRILLIEAGDIPPVESEIPLQWSTLLGSPYDWKYQTISNEKSCLGYPHGSCAYPRGKMISGSSGMNGMLYVLGNRRDFTIWEKLGNPTWGYDEVLKYYRKAENYLPPDPYNAHGINGPLIVDRSTENRLLKRVIIQGAQEAGQKFVDDYRDGHYLGIGSFNVLLVNGTRNSPAKAYIKSEKPNLKIIRNAMVTKINFDRQKRANSISFVYEDKNNKLHKLEARCSKEVIVSAGTIESPKLLMLSGIGPRNTLKKFNIPVVHNSPGVGRNFQDHVYTELHFTCEPIEGENFPDDLYKYLVHRSGPFTGVSLADLSGFLNIGNKSDLYPNIQTGHLWSPKGTKRNLFNPLLLESVTTALKQSAVLTIDIFLLNPKSKGSLSLSSADYRDSPEINPNFLSVDDDVRVLIAAIRKILKLQNTPTFRNYGIRYIKPKIQACDGFNYESDAYWECYLRYISNMSHHIVGTVKMGPNSDASSVVDHQLRVKGVRGVRVIDGSIMPNVVSANTQASVVAIAEKATDFIKKDWCTHALFD